MRALDDPSRDRATRCYPNKKYDLVLLHVVGTGRIRAGKLVSPCGLSGTNWVSICYI